MGDSEVSPHLSSSPAIERQTLCLETNLEIKSLDVALKVLTIERETRKNLEQQVVDLQNKIQTYDYVIRGLLASEDADSGSRKNSEFSKACTELLKRTNSIEAYQVAETLEEELDFEGRFSANRLEQETEKTQKWRRTGAIKLSKDYRDVL